MWLKTSYWWAFAVVKHLAFPVPNTAYTYLYHLPLDKFSRYILPYTDMHISEKLLNNSVTGCSATASLRETDRRGVEVAYYVTDAGLIRARAAYIFKHSGTARYTLPCRAVFYIAYRYVTWLCESVVWSPGPFSIRID